jgi:plasmid maintenance system antidote protein VapI
MSAMLTPHPSVTLRYDILPALNLQVGEAAAHMGVDRITLSKVLNGPAAISLRWRSASSVGWGAIKAGPHKFG